MSKRVLLAGLFHETNTFLREVTCAEDFRIRYGENLLDAADDASPLSGALEVARMQGWDLLPVIDMRAMPSGTVADHVIRLFWFTLLSAVERAGERPIDGVFLVLHGAMASEGLQDVEGTLLSRIRRLPALRNVPVCGVLDLHANVTEQMCTESDGLVAYRENPHTDAREAATRGAWLLERLMEAGEPVKTYRAQPAIVWPPTGTGTADLPMSELERRAREIEAADARMLAVNVFAGFSFADTFETGPCFTVITNGSRYRARKVLAELSELAWSLREEGNRLDMPLEEAVASVSANGPGPALLVEPADNIGAGAPGDTTALLRALMRNGAHNAGVIINDPETVKQLHQLRPGASAAVSLGGKSGVPGAAPLDLCVELVSVSDGQFQLEDPQSHLASIYGRHIFMGPCAVVRHGGITVLVTSRKTPPFDLGQWRSQGIEPEKLSIIGVKAAVAHRRAYDPIARCSFSVSTPGPCASNLRLLPYRRIRRPIYPLDEYSGTASGQLDRIVG